MAGLNLAHSTFVVFVSILFIFVKGFISAEPVCQRLWSGWDRLETSFDRRVI